MLKRYLCNIVIFILIIILVGCGRNNRDNQVISADLTSSSTLDLEEASIWEEYELGEETTGVSFINKSTNEIQTYDLPQRDSPLCLRWNHNGTKAAIYSSYESEDKCIIINLEDKVLLEYSIFKDTAFIETTKLATVDADCSEIPASWTRDGELSVEISFTDSKGQRWNGRYWYDDIKKTCTDIKTWPLDDGYYSTAQMNYDFENVKLEDLTQTELYGRHAWWELGSLYGLIAQIEEENIQIYSYLHPMLNGEGDKAIVIKKGNTIKTFDWDLITYQDHFLYYS